MIPERFLLVDFENVSELALSRLPEKWHVRIFIGRSQNAVPFALVSDAQNLGERLAWIKIAGDGRNNLDFHLAYHLGRLVKEWPTAAFVILSKDHGFDALLAHIADMGVQCRRLNSFDEVASPPNADENPNFTRAYGILSKINEKSRPRRRESLYQHVAAIFQKKLPEKDVQRTVEELFARGLVSEANNALTYHF